jgi:hypothetical protein
MMLLRDVPIGYTVKANVSYTLGHRWWHNNEEFDPAKETVIATKVADDILAWHEDQFGTNPKMPHSGYAGASYCSPDALFCVLAPA